LVKKIRPKKGNKKEGNLATLEKPKSRSWVAKKVMKTIKKASEPGGGKKQSRITSMKGKSITKSFKNGGKETHRAHLGKILCEEGKEG